MKNRNHTIPARKWVLVPLFFLLTGTFAFADHNININTADKEALMSLNGIGEVKATAIVDYRATNGLFQKKEDIMNVSGIGPATYDNIKDHIVVQAGSSVASSPSPQSPAPSPTPSSSQQSVSASSPPTNDLVIEAGSDRMALVGADMQFTARAYRNKTNLENAIFVWNFGDGSTAQGGHVMHRYEYAGRYAVVVTSSYDGASATDRFTVTAEVAQLAVRVVSDGGVEVENRAQRDADLSGWIVQSASNRFTLPENSLVLAGQTMRISPNTLHFFAGDATELRYPSGVFAFRAGEDKQWPTSNLVAAESVSTPIVLPTAPVSAQPDVTEEDIDISEIVRDNEEAMVEQVATSSQVAAAAESGGSWGWWMGALGLAALAGGAVVVSRRFSRKEWNIIEE